MKIRLLFLFLTLVAASIIGPGRLLAKDKEPAAENDATPPEKDAKKNITVLVLNAKAAAVHAAALEALASVGAEIKKDSAGSIEAKRSNKMGLAVGSGGEKLFVEIKDLGPDQVELKVTTKKTMLGYVGQKLWNEEVAGKIRDAVKAK